MLILQSHEIAAYVTKDDRVSIISYAQRIGGVAFIAAIEWYWYPPNSPRNRFYDSCGAEWGGDRWLITTFPAGRLPAVHRLAKQLGLRLANGVPIIFGNEKSLLSMLGARRPSELPVQDLEGIPYQIFPGGVLPNGADNMSLFALENDRGSPVYKNDIRDADTMLTATHEINTILNRGVRLTPIQIADYIYGSGRFPNGIAL